MIVITIIRSLLDIYYMTGTLLLYMYYLIFTENCKQLMILTEKETEA